MITTGIILQSILRIFALLVIARVIVEMIESFSRSFRPPRWFAVVAEPIFVVTDPPVKALRRLIPPLNTGNVAIDLSVIVLFVIIMLLQILVAAVFL